MKRILAVWMTWLLVLYGVFSAAGQTPKLQVGGEGEAAAVWSGAAEAGWDGKEESGETEAAAGAGPEASQVEAGPEVSAPSAILMEASTGQVICEKGADEQRSPASITKIMTLILIFDALESGKISLDDQVVTSAHAKSMGGSQVFLEEGETQTVATLPPLAVNILTSLGGINSN